MKAIIITNQIMNKVIQALSINKKHINGYISEQLRRFWIQFGNDKVPNGPSILSMEYYLKINSHQFTKVKCVNEHFSFS